VNLQEIENALSMFKACPKCNSAQGFWLGLKRERAYAQCKSCGTNFELFEVFQLAEKDKSAGRLRFLRK